MTDQRFATDQLRLAAANAAAMWNAVAMSRGYVVERGDGFFDLRDRARLGRRILTTSPDADREAIGQRVDRWTGRVVVEDAFSRIGVSDLPGAASGRLASRQLPVMVRSGGPNLPTPNLPTPDLPTPDLPVRPAGSATDLLLAERTIVTGFPLEPFLPYQPGSMFGRGLLDHAGVRFFLAGRDGVPAGACLAVDDGEAVGFYWVTTMPEHRSNGVGRSLMYGAIAALPDRPITLTASSAGRPLYESMGFTVAGTATWWSASG